MSEMVNITKTAAFRNLTWVKYAGAVQAILSDLDNGKMPEISGDTLLLLKAKTDCLLDKETKKAESAKQSRAVKAETTGSKVSESTQAIRDTLIPLLTDVGQTAAELNAKAGTDYTALRVANALKGAAGVKKDKNAAGRTVYLRG